MQTLDSFFDAPSEVRVSLVVMPDGTFACVFNKGRRQEITHCKSRYDAVFVFVANRRYYTGK